MSFSTKKCEGGQVLIDNFSLLPDRYSPAVASIVEFHVELHGGTKVHAGY